MKIKQITTLLVLSLTLFLTACQDSVSNDDETSYGTVFLSEKGGRFDSDEVVRETIEFNMQPENVDFQAGYYVTGGAGSAGGQGTFYAASYKLLGKEPLDPNEWAVELQKNIIKTWVVTKDKSDSGGETIYETDEFVVEGYEPVYAAVKVEYVKQYQTYWVYIAIPATKIGAADDPKVNSRFNELLDAQK